MAERLEMAHLTRDFGDGAGVFDVGFAVGAGEVHALVGLNGAGKTTLMRLILGMLRPETGWVRINGCDIRELPATGWSRVGHVIEHPFAYPERDTRTNLLLAARLRGVGPREAARTVDAVISELDLGRYAAVVARRLSHGNRQRLGLAAALQHQPEVIVLDEPTSTLDPAGVISLREALLRRADDGAGILVSSHHLDEIARIAHRITVVNRGRTIGSLDPGGHDIERAFFSLVHADDDRSLV